MQALENSSMQHDWEIDDETMKRVREYLRLLATSQVDTWLQQRVDASDLVQKTMLDAVDRKDQFHGDSDAELLAWLRRILTNNLIDAIRYHGRAKRDVARDRSLDEDITKSFRRVDALAATQSSPSQKAVTNDQLLRLPAALEKLPGAQREAIVMHHLQGSKLSEIATALGRSEAAIAGLLHRGMRRLHQLLEE